MVKIGTIVFMDEVYILKDVGIHLQKHKDINLYVKCWKLSKIFLGRNVLMGVASLGYGSSIPNIYMMP